MKLFHLILGLVLFVVFVVTGRFMRIDFPDKESLDQMLRVLMRSRHIYILFIALIHMLLGVYLTLHAETLRRVIQYVGSAILTISAGLFIWAFIVESYYLAHFSDISRYGIYTSLAGIGIHLVASLRIPSRET